MFAARKRREREYKSAGFRMVCEKTQEEPSSLTSLIKRDNNGQDFRPMSSIDSF